MLFHTKSEVLIRRTFIIHTPDTENVPKTLTSHYVKKLMLLILVSSRPSQGLIIWQMKERVIEDEAGEEEEGHCRLGKDAVLYPKNDERH